MLSYEDWDDSEAEYWLKWYNTSDNLENLHFQCGMSCKEQCTDYIDVLYTTYKFYDGSSLTLDDGDVAGITY